MSTLATVRSAIGSKIGQTYTTATIMYGADSPDTAQVRKRGTVVNILFMGEDADPSLILGAQYQERVWTWEIQVITPSTAQDGAANEDAAWAVLNGIEQVLAPNASEWHPETDCGAMQLVDKRLYGATQSGFLATATFSHVKWL